jgi:predicted acetyltransferase
MSQLKPISAGRYPFHVHVEVKEASVSDERVLENLLSLYLHDFSEAFGSAPGAEGRFEYDRLPLYFEEPHRSAFLIRSDGLLAGFALVSLGSVMREAPDVRDLSEFFVVRGLRHRGIGGMAATAVFKRFPGAWEVRALDRNRGAAEFWAHVISRHTRGAFEMQPWEQEPGHTWKVFRFFQGADAV